MSFYNFIVERLILSAGDALLNTTFVQELHHWRRLDQLKPYTIAQIQEDRLAKLLQYASSSIPFYQNLGISPNKDYRKWLQSFPVMHKTLIKKHLPNLINGTSKSLICEKSSGSSGIQGEVYMTRKEQFAAIAAQTHLWEWAGYQLGASIFQLGMTTDRGFIKKFKDILLRTEYQQAFRINKEEASLVLNKFINKQAFMGGYASGLFTYACLAEEMNIRPAFKAVISWGDKMFPHYREKIEQQFNTRVFDTYGATEGFIIAGQCEYASYHILTPNIYLELLDDKGEEVKPGELGHVVVTRLDAFAMPLIRYYLGDLAIKKAPEEKCKCGRPYPMLEKIVGRDTDIVKTRTGKHLIVHFFTGIFEHITEIRQFRVIQDSLDGIIIEYIPEKSFVDGVLNSLNAKIMEHIHEPFKVYFREVKSIPDTPSGKPQIIVSNLPKL